MIEFMIEDSPPVDAKPRQVIALHRHHLRLRSPMFGKVNLGVG